MTELSDQDHWHSQNSQPAMVLGGQVAQQVLYLREGGWGTKSCVWEKVGGPTRVVFEERWLGVVAGLVSEWMSPDRKSVV